MLDLYTDYLISSTKYTTATGLSRLFNNRFSHDKVTRFLNSQELDNKKLWSFIKPYDHSKGRSIKGINVVNLIEVGI